MKHLQIAGLPLRSRSLFASWSNTGVSPVLNVGLSVPLSLSLSDSLLSLLSSTSLGLLGSVLLNLFWVSVEVQVGHDRPVGLSVGHDAS